MNSRQFFNSVAGRWDLMARHPADRVERILDLVGPRPGARVLDVGSGTGVLIPYLIERIGPEGKLVALDVAEAMIAASRERHAYPNLEFARADFLDFSTDGLFDLAIAYSCYPHFMDKPGFFSKARSLLREGGRLAIAHIEGRAAINALHDGLDGPDFLELAPVADTVAAAGRAGFAPVATLDDDDYYLAVLAAN